MGSSPLAATRQVRLRGRGALCGLPQLVPEQALMAEALQQQLPHSVTVGRGGGRCGGSLVTLGT